MTEFQFTREYIVLTMKIRHCIEHHPGSSSLANLGHKIGQEMLAYLTNGSDIDHVPFKQLSEDIKCVAPNGIFFDEKVLSECLILGSQYQVEDLKRRGLDQLSWKELREKGVLFS